MPAQLDLPPLEPPRRDTFPATPDQARKWSQQLARMEMREAVKRFRHGLATINGLDIDAKRRLEMLELLRPTAREILDYLGRGLQMYTLPLPERGRKLFHLNIELLQELALGYEIALVSGVGDSKEARTLTAKGLSALAGERALAARGELMLRSGQVYAPLLKGFWRRTHAVYAQIEATPAVERDVREPQAAVAKAPQQSPHTMYKRLLLFAAAGPNALRKAEIDRVYRALEDWAPHAHLRQPSTETDGAPGKGKTHARFAVDIASASPPIAWGLYRRGVHNSLRVLDLGEVVNLVKRQIEQTPALKEGKDTVAPDRLSAMTLRRLARAWQSRPRRNAQRVDCGERAEVEVSLVRIHARMSEERERPRADDDATRAAIPDTSNLAYEASDNDRRRDYAGYITHPAFAQDDETFEVWDEVARGRSRTPGYVSARADAERDKYGADREHWRLEDSSETGFRVQWRGHAPSRATVGELIAVRTALVPPRWRIGIVRWMRFLGEANFKAGAHELTTYALPAGVRRIVGMSPSPAMGRHNDAEASPALLRRGRRARGEPPRLIVPAHMFAVGEKLKLSVRGREIDIQLDRIDEYSGSFSQFAISRAETEWEIL